MLAPAPSLQPVGLFAPAPRFVTYVPPGTPNLGAEIARLARVLGKPLQPWQRLVVDGATSLRPDGTFMFHDVLVSTPRQSGKTTLLGAVLAHRIMTVPGATCYFTAQTGKDGRERMLDLIKLVMASPLAPLFKPRYAAGSEGLELSNRSRLQVFAPGPAALHGTTPHLVALDEIWKHDQVRGTELMGAIGPAQATLGDRSQLWMFSTMGTAQSGFLNGQIAAGRAGADGLFYVEWSMPDDLDAFEPATWWQFHPALGNTITEDYLAREAAKQPLGEWMRAYMNRLTSAIDPLMPADDWDSLAVEPLQVPSRRDVAISYDVADGGDSAAVMASWRDTDGVPVIRCLHDAPGTAWLVPYVAALASAWQPAIVAADDGGDTRRITDELRRAGLEIRTLMAGEFATSCMALLHGARDRQLRHDGSMPLARAISVAALQPMGDGLRFSRRKSAGSVAPLIAAAAGLWAFDHREPSLGKPVTRW